jgi:hypothetical protein
MSICCPRPVWSAQVQRGKDRVYRIEPGQDIGHGDADLLRLPSGAPVTDMIPLIP